MTNIVCFGDANIPLSWIELEVCFWGTLKYSSKIAVMLVMLTVLMSSPNNSRLSTTIIQAAHQTDVQWLAGTLRFQLKSRMAFAGAEISRKAFQRWSEKTRLCEVLFSSTYLWRQDTLWECQQLLDLTFLEGVEVKKDPCSGHVEGCRYACCHLFF